MAEITALLEAVDQGDADAKAQLFERVYDDLKRLASRQLADERPGHTLQTAALVNETYLRLLGSEDAKASEGVAQWKGRRHFFGAAAGAMRRILVESARRKGRRKHGGEFRRLTLDPDKTAAPEMAAEVLALDEALDRLVAVEPQVAELVQLRFFAGLTLKEAAEQLPITLPPITRLGRRCH